MNDNREVASLYEKQVKIHNRWVNGFYQNIRSLTIWITLGIFFLAPWITWYGHQAILFDVSNRKFHCFNLTFWPQDFYLLVLLIISAALSLIVVTKIAGRLWCGYTCPQTVWTKCFMWLEYMIEGDRNKRLKHDKDPWHFATMLRRGIKHVFWLLLAAYTAMTFVGYFIPIHDVMFFEVGGWGFFWIAFFTLATYLNAGWMREQVCLYICPYARFQSVMLDQNTLVISYDKTRGEPRGSLKSRQADQKAGDCIDCSLCVQVCPTGIDIRKGLQMACIGCAACVDICDSVMDKVKSPRGLIRYSTQNALDKKETKFIRPSLVGFTVLLAIILATFIFLFSTRIPLQMNVRHEQRNLYRVMSTGLIENSYILSVSNMTQQTQTYAITLENAEGITYIGPKTVTLGPGESQVIPVTLTAPEKTFKEFNATIRFRVQSEQDPTIRRVHESNFFSPQ